MQKNCLNETKNMLKLMDKEIFTILHSKISDKGIYLNKQLFSV